MLLSVSPLHGFFIFPADLFSLSPEPMRAPPQFLKAGRNAVCRRGEKITFSCEQACLRRDYRMKARSESTCKRAPGSIFYLNVDSGARRGAEISLGLTPVPVPAGWPGFLTPASLTWHRFNQACAFVRRVKLNTQTAHLNVVAIPPAPPAPPRSSFSTM